MNGPGPAAGPGLGNPARTNNTYFRVARHTNGSNFLMADGHAKYLLAAQVSPGFTNGSSICGQDQAINNGVCAASYGGAAGTGALQTNGVNFVATFSTN